MCSACGFPTAPGHWTDAGATSPGDRVRLRFIRLGVVNRILAPYGLKAHDDGVIPGLQLFASTGERVLVPDLSTLWREAGRLAGEPVDPMSDRAISHV